MPGLVAERLGDRLSQHDAGIFGGVVEIDVQVALGAQRNVDQGVARQLLQHVVEKADAGFDVVGAGAVEIDGRRDLGFLGLAGDRGLVASRSSPSTLRTGHVRRRASLRLRRTGTSVYQLEPAPGNGFGWLAPGLVSESEPAYLNARPMSTQSQNASDSSWHATTILTVRKGGKVVIAGDGQVSLGQTVIKSNARKVRRLGKGDVIGGFAGATADAFTCSNASKPSWSNTRAS